MIIRLNEKNVINQKGKKITTTHANKGIGKHASEKARKIIVTPRMLDLIDSAAYTMCIYFRFKLLFGTIGKQTESFAS